jgi:hypothetical protein
MVIITGTVYFLRTRNKRLLNKKIEQVLATSDLVDLRIEFLAQHTSLTTVATAVAKLVVSAIRMDADPYKVTEVFQNLGLFTTELNEWDTTERLLIELIQQYIKKETNPYELKRYEGVVGKKNFSYFKKLLEASTKDTLRLMPMSLS